MTIIACARVTALSVADEKRVGGVNMARFYTQSVSWELLSRADSRGEQPFLPARRIEQYSAHAPAGVRLKRDPNGELRDKKVSRALRTQPQPRKPPTRRQLERQEVRRPNDLEHSFALHLVPACVRI